MRWFCKHRPNTGKDVIVLSGKKNPKQLLESNSGSLWKLSSSWEARGKASIYQLLITVWGRFRSELGWRHLSSSGYKYAAEENIVPSYLLQSPCWNLLQPRYWQLNSSLNHSLTHCFNQLTPTRRVWISEWPPQQLSQALKAPPSPGGSATMGRAGCAAQLQPKEDTQSCRNL